MDNFLVNGYPLTIETYCELDAFQDATNVQEVRSLLEGDFQPSPPGSGIILSATELDELALCIFNALNDEEMSTTVQQSIQQQSMDHHQTTTTTSPTVNPTTKYGQLVQLQQLQQQLQQNNIKSSSNSQQQNQNSIGSTT